jgi:hypothetical protein
VVSQPDDYVVPPAQTVNPSDVAPIAPLTPLVPITPVAPVVPRDGDRTPSSEPPVASQVSSPDEALPSVGAPTAPPIAAQPEAPVGNPPAAPIAPIAPSVAGTPTSETPPQAVSPSNPLNSDKPDAQDVLRLGGEDEDIRVTAIGKNPEAPDAAEAPEVAAEETGSRKWLWQVAAVAITVTAASAVIRQIQRRVQANAAVLAPAATVAAIPPKALAGAHVILEQLGDAAELRILQTPVHGKLTQSEKYCLYRPEAKKQKARDRFSYATETGSAQVDVQLLQTEAGAQRIKHVEHDAPPNHYAPVRLTVKAADDAPTLMLTSPDKTHDESHEEKVIALPSIEVAAHDQMATLNITLSRFPQGGVVSDGEYVYAIRKGAEGEEDEAVDVTSWNLTKLTFLPPASFSSSFLLEVQVTERREGQAEAITSASVKISAAPVNDDNGDDGDKRRSNTGRTQGKASPNRDETSVSAKTASITVHSTLAPPKPREVPQEVRYHVLNLASSRARHEPNPVINWSGQAPDLEVRDMGWAKKLFDQGKEKARSLAEASGLKFKMEHK